MNDTTKKLSGPAKDRFLERFFAAEPEIDPALADRLAARSKATFSSLRVRRLALGRTNRRRPVRAVAAGPASVDAPPVTPSQHAVVQPASAPDKPAATAFDPYVFGLVPVFQREGRDGLLAKLATVAEVDRLRQMAKAQQIVLPQALRVGEAGPEEIRLAIADAVAKRIADRRAAAG